MPHPPPKPAPPAANTAADATTDLADRARRLHAGRNAPKAGRALGQLGTAAMPALEAALGHASPFVRSGALYGLEAAAATGSDVVAAVIQALASDPDGRVRETACGVLGRLGPAAVARGTAALDAARTSADPRLRAAATAALTAR